MAMYQRKAKIVEATQWFPAMGTCLGITQVDQDGRYGIISRGVGYTFAAPGDYIVRGSGGDFTPVPAAVFEAEYEVVKSRIPATLAAKPGWELPVLFSQFCPGCGGRLILVAHYQSKGDWYNWSLHWACPEFPKINYLHFHEGFIAWPFEDDAEPEREDWEALGFLYLESEL